MNNVFPDTVQELIDEVKIKRRNKVPDGEKIELSQAMKDLINSAEIFGVNKKDNLRFGIKKSRNWNFEKKKKSMYVCVPDLRL